VISPELRAMDEDSAGLARPDNVDGGVNGHGQRLSQVEQAGAGTVKKIFLGGGDKTF
jgi:hypothetical protein